MNQELFKAADISDYLREYTSAIKYALDGLDQSKLQKAYDLLSESVLYDRRIFVAGNGGSAAIAEHLSCDFSKGTQLGLQVISLPSNMSIMTALANDCGYENVFSYQLQRFDLTDKDIVILISSSGNSPNIVRACSFAKSKRATLIGLSGFTGGLLRELSDISLHIPINNYGAVEDSHQVIMHVLTQAMIKKALDGPP